MIWDLAALAAPFLLAALGGLFSERAGLLNIALEGLMLAGAFTAILVTQVTGSWLLGTLGGVLAALLFSALFALVHHRLKTDLFITGLALNLLIPTLITLASQALFQTKGALRLDPTPNLHLWPDGPTVFVLLALLAVPATAFVLTQTRFGLRLRASGATPELLLSRGLNPVRYQTAALLLSGLGAGLAGAALALSLGAFTPNLSAGRGWIALVALYLGYRHPWGILIACLLFAGAESLAQRLQGSQNLPTGFILALPYLLTVLALVAYSLLRRRFGPGRRRKTPPASG